jgi:predicted polyphosphate/ATP-dependent NAD kinase
MTIGEPILLGLIVNPIAGIGGKVGLKGSDGALIQSRAIKLGAIPESENRTTKTLIEIKKSQIEVNIITYPGSMGEYAAVRCGIRHDVIGSTELNLTTAEDTRQAALDMFHYGVKLLLFAGGDGTARDIHAAIGQKVPVIGLPTGVKIHSAVFATSPQNAGALAVSFLFGKISKLREAEVMDIDERALRKGIVSAKLYGYLSIPNLPRFLQGLKTASSGTEKQSMGAIARCIVESMKDECIYIVGPGTTTREIANELDLPKTLVGVDVFCGGRILAQDVNESQLLQILDNGSAKIIVTPIGGQGYIFGRGNQQLSHKVISRVGISNIEIVATREKINAFRGKALMVDTGSDDIDTELTGYHKVITGYNEAIVYKVNC